MQINESNLDQYLHHLTHIYRFSHSNQYFNSNHIIDFISGHFISIEKSKLTSLPKPILYSIISNDHLKLDNEDALFDFIQQIFSIDSPDDENEFNINDFLEKVNFLRLSENKLGKAFARVEFDKLGRELWLKIASCSQYYKNSINNDDATRYRLKKLHFKPTANAGNLNGIIRYLTNVAGGNVHDKGVVTLSSLSIYPTYKNSNVKFACDLDDTQETSLFHSCELPNSWLQYDFGERRVHPTHYSIRCRNFGFDASNPRDWILEGSNTADKNDWKKLDERKGDTSFMMASQSQTFDVREELEPNESFRFLRIKQNGQSTNNKNWFVLSAMEYYGDLYDLQ